MYEEEEEWRVGGLFFFFFFNETKNTQEKDLQISRKIANYVSRRKSQQEKRKYACTRKTVEKVQNDRKVSDPSLAILSLNLSVN